MKPYEDEALTSLTATSGEALNKLLRSAAPHTVASAIVRLPARERVILGLLYFEDFRVLEVAYTLGMQPQEVSASVVLALSRIQQALGEEAIADAVLS